MAEGFSNSIIGGAETLIRSAMKSANYVLGLMGWRLTRDGDAELNTAVIRGSIIAGGGTVRLDSGGVKVTGPVRQFDINFNAGFLARKVPDDGSFQQLSSLALFTNPPDPSGLGLGVDAGSLSADYVNSGLANETPELTVFSPTYTGKTSSHFTLYGQAANDAGVDDTSHMDIVAHDIQLLNDATAGQVSYQRNLVNLATNLNVAPSQFFTITINVIIGDTAVALGNTNYPVAFPAGSTVFGVANISSGAGNSSLWQARFLPVSNTQFNCIVYRNPAAAAAFALPIQILTWVVA
jgi:hypothetical protein